MYRIARIRMSSIGPDDARFDRPSARLPRFELDFTSRGCAIDSVVWLENGGGKTVFLTLLFHALRPDHAAQIGDEHGKRGGLDDFIRGDDVAHVQVEWHACDASGTQTGERVITGLVAERGSRAATNDRIDKSWYALVVRDPNFTLDHLATEANGRRIPKRIFLENLSEMAKGAGRRSLDLRRCETHAKWLTALSEIGLDPALLEYQVTMNRKEGGAASLFRFSTDEKFLWFFLELVTDPEALDAADETVGRVAEKLASLPSKEREVRFADGALPYLEHVAAEFQRARRATVELNELRAAARGLAARLGGATREATTRVATEAERARNAEERASNADRRRRGLDDERRLLAIAHADLRVAAAQSALGEARKAESLAVLERDAWAAVPARLDVERGSARVDALTAAFSAVEKEAEPIRRSRDAAGSALRRRLLVDSLLLRVEIREREQRQRDVKQSIKEDRRRASELNREAGRHRGDAKNLADHLDRHGAAIDRAVSARLLEPAEEPAAAVARFEQAMDAEKRRLDAIAEERKTIRTQRPGLEAEHRRLVDTAARAEEEARSQRERASGARAERARFTGDPAIAEAAGVAPHEVDLDAVGPAIVERLEATARSADGRRIDVELRGVQDRRAVESLDGGAALLPPRHEVSEVLDRLRAAGIPGASAGWRHLADATAPGQRLAVLTALPALADGIVVAEQTFPRVVSALEGVVLHPAAAVVIGTIEAMETAETANVTSQHQYVIPPAPALYDRAAATTELEIRRERLSSLDAECGKLNEEAHLKRSLAIELRTHLEKWRPGMISLAETAAGLAAERHAQLAAKRTDVANRLEHLAERDLHLENESREIEVRHEAHASALRTLQALAQEATDLEGAAETIARLQARAEELEREAERLDATAEQAQEELQDLAGRVAELGMSARSASQQAAAVQAPMHDHEPLLSAADSDADPDALELAKHIAADTVAATLRETFITLDRALAAATTESQAATDLRTARGELANAESRWALLSMRVQERAIELAATPHAHDAIALDAAARAAQRQLENANAMTIEVNGRLTLAKRERQGLPSPDRVGARLEVVPTTEEEARHRLAETDVAYLAAATERADAEAECDAAAKISEHAKQRARLLEQQVKILGNALRETVIDAGEFSPYTDSVEDAQAAVEAVTSRLAATTVEVDDATSNWRRHASRVNAFAREDTWTGMQGAVFRRLAHDAAEQIAVDAADLVSQLGLLKERLAAEIASMSDHRRLLGRSLAELVGSGISNLKQAQTRSRLPDHLGDWSHKPFLKIDFDVPSETDIEQRLATYVLELIEMPRERRPAGKKLVTAALLKCVAGGVKVSVLKPNRAMALTYVPIGEMAILSGGMRATAAIAMFCTLARVRAANRTQAQDKGVATLILDNPFGDASAVYLVWLQRLVAEGAGIQLVYTTGIKDLDALRQFPNPIRLSNQSSRRAGLAYVTGDPDFLRQLWPEGDEARLEATRVQHVHAPRLIL